MLTAKEVALQVTKALDEKKGIDIKLLKIDKVSSLADYFLKVSPPVQVPFRIEQERRIARSGAPYFAHGGKVPKAPPGVAHAHFQCAIPLPPDPLFFYEGPFRSV